MTNSAKFTHTLWAGTSQPEWAEAEQERLVNADEGWIDKDSVAHLRIDSMPLEGYFTGYLQLTPRGKLPMKQDASRDG
jgi:hypothetical protein